MALQRLALGVPPHRGTTVSLECPSGQARAINAHHVRAAGMNNKAVFLAEIEELSPRNLYHHVASDWRWKDPNASGEYLDMPRSVSSDRGLQPR